MTVQTLAIVVILLSINLSYLVVLSKYKKSSKFEDYSVAFPNREQQFMWRVLPFLISVLNITAVIFAGVTNTTRLIPALMFILVSGRPFIRALVWFKSSRRMWVKFVLMDEIPIAMGTLVTILLLDYFVFTGIAGPLFG